MRRGFKNALAHRQRLAVPVYVVLRHPLDPAVPTPVGHDRRVPVEADGYPGIDGGQLAGTIVAARYSASQAEGSCVQVILAKGPRCPGTPTHVMRETKP